jgi:hypothetical protein
LLTVTRKQFEELADLYHNDYLLEVVSDWYALYENIYETPAQTPFDEAWDLAEYLLERLQAVPQEWEREVSYELIHQVLLANEQGWPLDQLPAAIDQFCESLPATEAAFALLRLAIMGGGVWPAGNSGQR